LGLDLPVEVYYVCFGLLYVLAIYFSWNNGFESGVVAGGEACFEVLVEEEIIQTSVDGEGNIEVSGTMMACPKCSPYVNKEKDKKES